MRIKNLTAYEDRTDAILSWGRDWITSEEFDAKCEEYERAGPKAEKRKAVGFAGSDYILPSMVGNMSPNGDWIFLVQTLVSKRLVRRKIKGGIRYRTVDPEKGKA